MVTTNQSYQEKVSQMISWGHWFTLFNILLALPIGSLYLFATDWPHTLAGRVYAFVSWLGHFSFLCFAIYLLILFPLTFLVTSQRLLRGIASVIATAGLTLLIVDTAIFSHFRLHLNPIVWELITNPDEAELSRDWQFLFISVPIIFLIQMLISTWAWQKLRSLNKRRFVKPVVWLFISSFFASHLAYIWADANFYRPITMQRANLPLSYPMTARGFLEKHGLFDRQAYQDMALHEGNPAALAIEYPLGSPTFAKVNQPYNVLMVVVDGLRLPDLTQDMPNLSQFAQSNIQFNQHYSSGNTDETSLVGLFYGISPSYLDGILSGRKPSALITSLHQQHYQLGLFSSDGFNAPLYRQALFSDFSLPKIKNISNQLITQQWQQWLAESNNEQPWFSYINFANNPASTRKANEPANRFVQRYQKSADEIDQQIETILQTLAERNLMDNTVVIITANYGIGFNDAKNNIWGSGQDYSRTQLHVPLIIHWPQRSAEVINKLTSHQDVMATLMQNLLGVTNNPKEYTQGENLFTPERKTNWVISGDPSVIVITTPDQTLILGNNGNYRIYDKNYQLEPNQKPSLSLLLQVLTDIKRFIAN